MKIYELHLDMFCKSNVRELLNYVDHFKKIGVSHLQIMPLHYTENTESVWGYMPTDFTRITSKYGTEEDLIETIRVLQKHKIDCIIDVVYNHCDDNRRFKKDWFLNDDLSGCGNTFDCSNDEFKKIIVDSLIHFKKLGFVGYRFDLASVLAYDANLHWLTDKSAIMYFKQIPELSDQIFIAEPWSCKTYNLGQFPNHWYEHNDKFRDTVRRYAHGESVIFDLIHLIRTNNHRMINYVSVHDGFTLNDLFSYNGKHNDENGEHNRDGSDSNWSKNYGCEGYTIDHSINTERIKRIKLCIAILILFSKNYIVLAGDEYLRTQNGNNNSYKKIYPIPFDNYNNIVNDYEVLSNIHDAIDYTNIPEILNCSLEPYNDLKYHYKFFIADYGDFIIVVNSSSTNVEYEKVNGEIIYSNTYAINGVSYAGSITVFKKNK